MISVLYNNWYQGLKILMIIQLHVLHPYYACIQYGPRITVLMSGLLLFTIEINRICTLYIQYYDLLLSKNYPYIFTLSRNQFSECATNWRPSNYTLSFHNNPQPFGCTNKSMQPINLLLSIEPFHGTCKSLKI